MFDSRERIEAILGLLEQEVDFSNLTKQKIILEHYPLHQRNIQSIISSFNGQKWKLMIGFWTKDFYQNFESMNFIKAYYGEKFAFEFAFLVHYQAWLFFPALVGVLLTGFQAYQWQYHSLDKSVDGTFNGIYGIFLTLWSTAFVESWKRKEKVIKYYWAIDDATIEKSDERKDQFKFSNFYNDVTLDKEKKRVPPNKAKKCS